MTSWSSPVLGESVSMYEEMGRHSAEPQVAEDQEDVAELYHNILGQVCLTRIENGFTIKSIR